MELKQPITYIFAQLEAGLVQISNDEYSRPLEVLNQATIGQHYRHILEMFTCLLDGLETGNVNYDNRKRDKQLEENKNALIEGIKNIEKNIGKPDRNITLHANYSPGDSGIIIFKTTYYRELAYALEHTVHHMALIKIGFKALVPKISLPEDFVVAASTTQYRLSLVDDVFQS